MQSWNITCWRFIWNTVDMVITGNIREVLVFARGDKFAYSRLLLRFEINISRILDFVKPPNIINLRKSKHANITIYIYLQYSVRSTFSVKDHLPSQGPLPLSSGEAGLAGEDVKNMRYKLTPTKSCRLSHVRPGFNPSLVQTGFQRNMFPPFQRSDILAK